MKPAIAAVKTDPQPEPKPQPKRMTLANVVSGKRDVPMRVVVYGTDGIGKSTFAAGAPSVIFLGTEDGTSQLDVGRFPEPKSVADVFEAIGTLTREAHEFRTLAIDSLDWLEPLVWEHVCQAAGKRHIEDFDYGKGYTAAVLCWREILAALDELRRVRGMHVVCIAHAAIATYKNPDGDDYDRHTLKLHAKSAGIVREWADAVLYAKHEIHTVKDDKTRRVKGIETGARILLTEERAASAAKNRFGLPPEMPLSWAAFEEAVRGVDPAPVRERCEALLASLDEEKRAKGAAYLKTIATSVHKLNEFENRLKEIAK